MADTEAQRRKKLVVAAEDVMRRAFAQQGNGWKVEKAQLSQLIGVCGEALCAEEIENYLRYQASRERASWGFSLVDATVTAINGVIEKAEDDRKRIDAWRYYAVYLSRAFTYQKAASSGRMR